MSRAFVKESDRDASVLPERAVSPHPNLVTAGGLLQIETRVRELEAARSTARATERGNAGAAHDAAELARIECDLRYWSQRKASARLITPTAAPDAVRFGVTVTLQDDDGVTRTLRIVGEDEADPARGLVSWVSPVAERLLGCVVGDEIVVAGRRLAVVRLSAASAS